MSCMITKIMNNSNMRIIYIGSAGYKNTGEDLETGRVFRTRESAESYGKNLVISRNYDYFQVVEFPVT